MTTPSATDEPAIQLSDRARLEILGAILLALFLFALDQTVVGTALPVIVTDLGGNDLYTWAVTIYLLTSTISGPIYGKLSDLFGRRPIIIFAVSLFLIASVGAGLSQEMWQFILFRGLQGLGGGAVFPIALAVVADLYTPAERGKYLGLFGAVFGVSSLVGPAIGGLITDNFVVALDLLRQRADRPHLAVHPVAAAARHQAARCGQATSTTWVLPSSPSRSRPSSSASRTRRAGEWTDPSVGGLILIGLAFGALFVWIESRAPDPIVPLSLFRMRSFSISVTAMFLAAFGFFGAVIFLPRWFQTVAGASATESGYSILPLLFGLIFSAIASGQIVARTGRYKALILGSFVLLAVGLWVLTNLQADTDRLAMSLWMLITGLGIGPSFAVFTLIVQNAVSPDRIGVATSSLTFFQQIGGTVGLTIAGTVFASRLTEEIPTQLLAAGVPQQFVDQFAGGQSVDVTGTGDLGQRILAAVPEPARAAVEPLIPGIVHAIYEAFSLAVASTFWVGIVGALIGAVVVLFLREEPMRSTFEFEAPAPAAEGSPG